MGSSTIHSDPPPLPPSSSPVITSSHVLDWIDGLTLVSHVLPSVSVTNTNTTTASAVLLPADVRANLHALSSHFPDHHHHHHNHTRPFAAVLVSDVYTHVIAAGLASLSRPGHVRVDHVSVADAYQGLGIGSHVAKTLVDIAMRGILLLDGGEGRRWRGRRTGMDMDMRVQKDGTKHNIGIDDSSANVSVSVVSTDIAVSLFTNLGFLPSPSLKSTLLTRRQHFNPNSNTAKRSLTTGTPDITLVGHYDVTYLPLANGGGFILPDHFSVGLLRDALRYYRAVVNDTIASPLIEHDTTHTGDQPQQQYVTVVRHRGSGAVVGAAFARRLKQNGKKHAGQKRFFIGPVVADTMQTARHGVRILCERLERAPEDGQEVETETVIEMRTLDMMPMRSFQLVWMGFDFERQEDLTYMRVTKNVDATEGDDDGYGDDEQSVQGSGSMNGCTVRGVEEGQEEGKRTQCEGELELVDTVRYFCLDR